MTDLWYTDEQNFWNYRAIWNARGLDYVPDRGGFKPDQRTDDRVAFIRGITDSKGFKEWVERQTPSSSDIYKVDEGNLHFRATNNGSYGYTYLWTWES